MLQAQPDFAERLHAHGFRATSERIRLLHILWTAEHPLTVDEIGRKMDCNLVTIYRALDHLARAGVVLRGAGSGHIRAARFSYRTQAHHHHLVCADCGFVKRCAACR